MCSRTVPDNTVPYYIYLCHATFEAPKAVLLQVQALYDVKMCRMVSPHIYQSTPGNIPKDLKMITALFWFITQQVLEMSCRRFGKICRSNLQEDFLTFFGFWTPKDGTDMLLRNVVTKLPLLGA